MVVKNCDYPKLSDWSMPPVNDSQNTETIEVNQYHTHDHQPRQLKPLHEPVKCWLWMSPCLQGLVLGIIINGLMLAVILTLWFMPHQKTGVIITKELPPGTILLYSGNLSTLIGSTHRWLLCDGSEISRITYRDLFSVIGIIYGPGNGNDTFNLPDLRARFPLGSNASNNSQLVSGGASSHVITVAEMPVHAHGPGSLLVLPSGVHTHSYTDPGHNHGGSTGSARMSAGSYSMISSGGQGTDQADHSHTINTDITHITIQPDGNHTHSVQGLTDFQGANQPIDMMPPYQTLHYIIRA